MAATIQIDIAKLQSALTKLNSLASTINTQRRKVTSDSPVDLPSLGDAQLGQVAHWLTTQAPELQTRLDLAKLLDSDGNGKAEYKVEHGDQLWEVKHALATQLTTQLQHLNITDVASRQRATLLAQILGRYQNDKDISTQVLRGLGPAGLSGVFNKLRLLRGSHANRYWEGAGKSQELQALIALQTAMGQGLAGMFGTASPRLGADYGTKLGYDDPWTATVLLKYVDQMKREIDPAVFAGLGVGLKRRENGNPSSWTVPYNQPDYRTFGTIDFGAGIKPTHDFLHLADNSTRNAQAVMGNKELARYFLSERTDDSDGLSAHAGNVLRAATIDVANSHNDQYAKNAATISSDVLWMLGQDAKPLPAVKDELGGIVAVYIADADRVFDEPGEGGPGIHLWGKPNGPNLGYGLHGIGLPKYGINLDQAILRNVLEDVGDDNTAKAAVGRAVALVNNARLDYGASQGRGGLATAAEEASSLVGFATDAFVNGNVGSERDAAAARQQIAQFFTLPLDLIPADRVPIVGDLIVGSVKDGLVQGFTADKTAAAITQGNSDKLSSTSMVKLQALYAMEKHHIPASIDWPRGSDGQPKPPGMLKPDELREILTDGDTLATGNYRSVKGTIETHWGTHVKAYGDS